jgi:hypothetical protein
MRHTDIREYFLALAEPTAIFIYGSCYCTPQTAQDIDVLIIRQKKGFKLFGGEAPGLGPCHCTVIGEDTIKDFDVYREVPPTTRMPFSQLMTPHKLLYESPDKAGYVEELESMTIDNIVDYTIPRLGLAFPELEGAEVAWVNPRQLFRISLHDIRPKIEGALKEPGSLKCWCGEPWKELTCDPSLVKKSLVERGWFLGETSAGLGETLYAVKLPPTPSPLTDLENVQKWRNSIIKSAITENFGEFQKAL